MRYTTGQQRDPMSPQGAQCLGPGPPGGPPPLGAGLVGPVATREAVPVFHGARKIATRATMATCMHMCSNVAATAITDLIKSWRVDGFKMYSFKLVYRHSRERHADYDRHQT